MVLYLSGEDLSPIGDCLHTGTAPPRLALVVYSSKVVTLFKDYFIAVELILGVSDECQVKNMYILCAPMEGMFC